MSGDSPASVKHCSCVELVPVSFRKPDLHRCESVFCRLCDRRDEHIVSEHILAPEVVSLLTLWIVIVEWAAERDAFVISLAGHCVYVWRHLVALTHCLADHICILLCEYPWLLVQGAAL